MRPPIGLLAELSYRCPLHCPYCSNPVALGDHRRELTGEQWCRVLTEARELGVLQLHLSGGEPLTRRDLPELVRHARRVGLYSNLVTSGVGLTDRRLAALVEAGLDHVQLSVQDSAAERSDRIAGTRSFERKRAAARAVKRAGLPLTVNVVLHRHNADRVAELAELAVRWGADRLELAHTQYYGWAALNQARLLPAREQVERSRAAARDAAERHGDRLGIVYVVPDLYEDRPKPCMHGWGRRHLVVRPNGDVLPCTAAGEIPGLPIENVLGTPLAEIWFSSESFNRFRGTDWMPDPCRGCPLREVDFGGCRCQALRLLGDASATDPVCALSPHHSVVTRLVEQAQAAQAGPDAASGPMVPRR
ncbi:pyrroloquinoline quinone biosynthesis protein PqqE [Thermomonospora echinospora]|nr:pyrroloquinoline quinone biosynthesis protein PqqE [Thermomonospora echinospora]